MDEGNYPVVITRSRGMACLKVTVVVAIGIVLPGFWLPNWVRSEQSNQVERSSAENARRS
jgi:hypothetical protein